MEKGKKINILNSSITIRLTVKVKGSKAALQWPAIWYFEIQRKSFKFTILTNKIKILVNSVNKFRKKYYSYLQIWKKYKT